MRTIPVAPAFHVAGQIHADSLAELKRLGFTTIINNRPDGENLVQPGNDELAARAKQEGLAYWFIPVGNAGLTADDLQQFRTALADSDGAVLAFCNSGNRSIRLWALAEAGQRDVEEILSLAGQAGFNLMPMRPLLQQLAAA